MKNINKIVIVGATGLVGRTFIEILQKSDIYPKEILFIASKKSEGKSLKFRDKEYKIRCIDDNIFFNADYVLFFTNKDVSKQYVPIAKKYAVVIDNSSAFRMDKDVPLIVPEINFNDIISGRDKIIANPNCATIQALLVINALRNVIDITSIHYSTYQSMSGLGMKGLKEYKNVSFGLSNNYLPYDISKTCIPEVGDLLSDGSTSEEEKMVGETKKILHIKNIPIVACCVRVPVEYCHGVSVFLTSNAVIDLNKVRKEIKMHRELCLLEGNAHCYPTSVIANKENEVFVGRLHLSEDKKTLCFYCVSDNLRRGAALNAFLILKRLL